MTIGHSSGIMRVLLLGLLVGSCGGLTPTIAHSSPMTVTGSTYSQTAPMPLSGDYLVTWTGQGDTGCFQGAFLKLVGGTDADDQDLGGGTAPDASPVTGTTHLYGLSGSYYVSGTSGCQSWSYTFAPQP